MNRVSCCRTWRRELIVFRHNLCSYVFPARSMRFFDRPYAVTQPAGTFLPESCRNYFSGVFCSCISTFRRTSSNSAMKSSAGCRLGSCLAAMSSGLAKLWSMSARMRASSLRSALGSMLPRHISPRFPSKRPVLLSDCVAEIILCAAKALFGASLRLNQ